ncbi:hypothetical protein [Streptomyces spinosisporus]|uniref:Uncharacterized protein n=1 Tax=Streptomyces spinosisporus TaxID=2927582 RepID=A0ABS9XWN6_9ACTN|nr:hypothetical protein [Streptomyces spinosisporus]MCI3246497.1 hypothetical protein [Streptomyces spinosisporus]
MTSRRTLTDRNDRQAKQIDRLIAERDAARHDAEANAYALQQVAGELSRCKDVVASHLVAAGHPSTVLHDVRHFRDSLQQALEDARVDLRLELARLEGSQL